MNPLPILMILAMLSASLAYGVWDARGWPSSAQPPDTVVYYAHVADYAVLAEPGKVPRLYEFHFPEGEVTNEDGEGVELKPGMILNFKPQEHAYVVVEPLQIEKD